MRDLAAEDTHAAAVAVVAPHSAAVVVAEDFAAPWAAVDFVVV
jgi:hypothetical protein